MEEREIDKILKPIKKLVILLIVYLSIAFLCIGIGFYQRVATEEKEEINLAELVSSDTEKVGQYVKLESNSLPILMTSNSEKDNQFYYVTDVSGRIYIVTLSSETFKNIVGTLNQETGELNSTYELKGITTNIDESIKKLAVVNAYKAFKDREVTSDNFSEYLDSFYIKENIVSERMVTLYTCSALFGVFFLVLALGYIVPGIIKVRKTLSNKELIEELRIELSNLTETPYKKQHIYLTKNYVISGIQAVKYEDIVWGYILVESKYGMKVGENLMVHTKDHKKHVIGSVATNNDILNRVLADIHTKNENMRVGYTEENKNLFED